MNVIAALVVLALVAYAVHRALQGKKQAVANEQQGELFLIANGEKDGVETSASGLQFQLLQAGEGATPTAQDRVRVHYHGTLIDGSVFDSSVERGEPISFGLNQVIAGWTEGLQRMQVGSKARLFIPSKLGYGQRAAGSIPPGSVLIFDVELLGINE